MISRSAPSQLACVTRCASGSDRQLLTMPLQSRAFAAKGNIIPPGQAGAVMTRAFREIRGLVVDMAPRKQAPAVVKPWAPVRLIPENPNRARELQWLSKAVECRKWTTVADAGGPTFPER